MDRTLEVVFPELHPGQIQVIEDPARFKVLAAGRRWRKTAMGVQLCLRTSLKGGRTWWVAPDYPRASIGWRFAKGLALQIPDVGIRHVDRTITFPSHGEFQVRSASDPDSLRGEGLDGAVMDEAAYIAEAAWTESLRPALADRQGWALFISTPKGTRNWFAKLYEKAKGLTGWQRWQFPTWSNPYVQPGEIEQARREMHPAIFSQEFGAEFLDLGSVKPFRPEWILRWEEAPDPREMFIAIGVDPAITSKEAAHDLDRLPSKTALVAVGVPKQGPERSTIYCLRAVANYWSPYESVGQILLLVDQFRPRKLRIEKVAWQAALKDITEREASLKGIHLPPIELVVPETDKLRRAFAVSPLVESGKLLFGPGQQHLIESLLGVPEEEKGWDYVDALGLAVGGVPHLRAPRSPMRSADESPEHKRAASYAPRAIVQAPVIRRTPIRVPARELNLRLRTRAKGYAPRV